MTTRSLGDMGHGPPLPLFLHSAAALMLGTRSLLHLLFPSVASHGLILVYHPRMDLSDAHRILFHFNQSTDPFHCTQLDTAPHTSRPRKGGMATTSARPTPPHSSSENSVTISPEQYAKLPRFYQAAALKPRPDVVVRGCFMGQRNGGRDEGPTPQ